MRTPYDTLLRLERRALEGLRRELAAAAAEAARAEAAAGLAVETRAAELMGSGAGLVSEAWLRRSARDISLAFAEARASAGELAALQDRARAQMARTQAIGRVAEGARARALATRAAAEQRELEDARAARLARA